MWVNLNKYLLGNNHDSILWGLSTHRTNIPGNNNCPAGTKNVECKKNVIKIFYISYIMQEDIMFKFKSEMHVTT